MADSNIAGLPAGAAITDTDLIAGSDAGSGTLVKKTGLQFNAYIRAMLAALPTTDPHLNGMLWNNGGVVAISQPFTRSLAGNTGAYALTGHTATVVETLGIPSGALAIWYADEYSASPSGIANAVGSTPLTVSGTADSNMYLSGTSLSGGAIDFNAGGVGNVLLSSATPTTTATVVYSCYKESQSTGWHSMISDHADFHNWAVGERFAGSGIGFYIDSATLEDGLQQTDELWDRVDAGWHISAHSYDATTTESWMNGVQLVTLPISAPASHTLQNLDICQIIGSFNAGYKINALAFYPRKLSAVEMRSIYTAFKARAALSSITIPETNPEKLLFAMGDSITFGTAGNSADPGYVYIAVRTASPVVRGVNLAVGGTGIVTTNTAFDATYGPLITAAIAASGRDIIATMGLGTNDLGSANSATWLTGFATLCDKVRATGAKLIIPTILPKSADAQFNTDRALANTTIRTWVGTHADAIADFAGDATMGPDAAAGDTTYYVDGIHPTSVGHALLAPYLVTALNSL